jgi:hypothetical protein
MRGDPIGDSMTYCAPHYEMDKSISLFLLLFLLEPFHVKKKGEFCSLGDKIVEIGEEHVYYFLLYVSQSGISKGSTN